MVAAVLRATFSTPLGRASLASSALMVAGDMTAQALQQGRRRRYLRRGKDSGWSLHTNDWDRSARFGWFGLTFKGPFFLYAYRLIDTVLGARLGPVVTLKTSIIKALTSNVCMDPFYVLGFFSYMGALEGMSPDRIGHKVRKAFLPAYTSGILFWCTANVINFRFVPPTQRVYCVGFFGLLWNIYLSSVNSRYSSEQDCKTLEQLPAQRTPVTTGMH